MFSIFFVCILLILCAYVVIKWVFGKTSFWNVAKHYIYATKLKNEIIIMVIWFSFFQDGGLHQFQNIYLQGIRLYWSWWWIVGWILLFYHSNLNYPLLPHSLIWMSIKARQSFIIMKLYSRKGSIKYISNRILRNSFEAHCLREVVFRNLSIMLKFWFCPP